MFDIKFIRSTVLIAAVFALGAIAVAYCVDPSKQVASVVHPGLVYQVTKVTDTTVTCVSDPFYCWPNGKVRATAKLTRNYDLVVPPEIGVRFEVTEVVGSYTKDGAKYFRLASNDKIQ